MRHILTIASLAAAFAGSALADAIPPPEQLSEVQQSLIGMWQEDQCVAPQGLGHACIRRVYVFGNESFAEAGLSDMAVSNNWGAFTRTGTWAASTTDGKAVVLKVKYSDATTADMTLALDAGAGFTLTSSSDFAMFPASHFSRLGVAIQPSKP